MEKEGGLTMFLSSDSGGVSSTKRSIWSHQRMGLSFTEKSSGIWNFTITADHINPWNITYRNMCMAGLHNFPFPAMAGKGKNKRIFEFRCLKEGSSSIFYHLSIAPC